MYFIFVSCVPEESVNPLELQEGVGSGVLQFSTRAASPLNMQYKSKI